jgi:hypothetical protein
VSSWRDLAAMSEDWSRSSPEIPITLPPGIRPLRLFAPVGAIDVKVVTRSTASVTIDNSPIYPDCTGRHESSRSLSDRLAVEGSRRVELIYNSVLRAPRLGGRLRAGITSHLPTIQHTEAVACSG